MVFIFCISFFKKTLLCPELTWLSHILEMTFQKSKNVKKGKKGKKWQNSKKPLFLTGHKIYGITLCPAYASKKSIL